MGVNFPAVLATACRISWRVSSFAWPLSSQILDFRPGQLAVLVGREGLRQDWVSDGKEWKKYAEAVDE